MNFFLDRNMPVPLAAMLSALERDEHVIRHHDDDKRFHPKTTDVEWISTIGKDSPPWIALTADGRILRRPVERKALWDANMTFFIMHDAWTQMQMREYAWRFLKTWPNILEAATIRTPTIFRVGAGSSLKVEPIERTR